MCVTVRYDTHMQRVVIISMIFLFLGCSTERDVLFEMNIEVDFKIFPGLSNLDTHYFILERVPTRINNYIQANNREIIGKILPNRAEITSRFNTIDFSIVREISVWAISSSNPDLRKEIFYQNRIKFSEQNELRLFSSLSEVSDILLEDEFDLEIRLNFRTFTPTEIDSRLRMNFIVNGAQ